MCKESVDLNIIIIDDDPEDREFLIEALLSINPKIVVNEAPTCISGLEDLKVEASPDYLFLDINMPYTNGKECLRIIKSNKKLKDIPVIMFTSSSDFHDREDCLRAGAAAYLVKTHNFDALVKMLRSIGIGPNTIKTI